MAKRALLLGAPTLGLQYPARDIALVREALEQHEFVTVEIDPAQGKAHIIDLLDEAIDSAKQVDTFVFYFSGHGMSPTGQLELVLSDDVQSVRSRLDIADVLRAFERMRAENKLVILDCCRATARREDWDPPQPDRFRILTASRMEVAKEIEEFQASFLTYHLSHALTDRAVEIADDQGVIRINQVFEWLKRETASYNQATRDRKVPEPALLGNQGADIAIGVLPSDAARWGVGAGASRRENSMRRALRSAAERWQAHGHRAEDVWADDQAEELLHLVAEHGQADLSAVESAFVKQVEVSRLLHELEQTSTLHPRRAKIGDRLAELGDQRPGVGVRNGLPDLAWCRVDVAETSFFIAKYPITFLQYQAFTRAPDGFANPVWWRGLDASDRHREFPGTQRWKTPNRPAEMVSWLDAAAMCRWLSRRLGVEVRLPDEREWRLAASAGALAYPWGPAWLSWCANTTESGLAQTTAVGMYPAGKGHSGALDLAGNVCEWTTTAGVGGKFIACGGSWADWASAARTSAHTENFPWQRLAHCGFRLVCNRLAGGDA